MRRRSLLLAAALLFGSGGTLATQAEAQRPQVSARNFRAALARPYRAIADSALARVLKSYPPGVTQGGDTFPYYATVADARTAVLGEKGDAGLSAVPIYPFLGPHGQKLAVVSFSLNDDPSDHGLTTDRTLIFDASGHVVASTSGYLPIKRVAGTNIVTQFGTIRWNGRRWSFPKPPEPVD